MSTAYARKAQEIGNTRRGIVTTHQGGSAFEVRDPLEMLRRFVILGTTSGSYYVNESKLTDDGIAAVRLALDEEGTKAVDEILRINNENIAPKLDPGLLAFALATVHDNIHVRKAAYENLDTVCRTASQLFSFMSFRRQVGGSSAGLRRALKRWYDGKSPDALVYQAIKYRERAGFSHKDMLAMARPKPQDAAHEAIYQWIVKGTRESSFEHASWQNQIAAYEMAKDADVAQTVRLIRDFKLPREAIRSDHLREPSVWDALLVDMPLMATLRNLGNMSKSGLLVKGSEAEKTVIGKINDREAIIKSRVHPMHFFIAGRQYEQGRGMRGSGSWTVSPFIVDACDVGYRMSFKNVEPSGKRMLVAVDSSGSMSHGSVMGFDGVQVAEAAAALAQVIVVTEGADSIAVDTDLHAFPVSERQRFTDVARQIQRLGGGGTHLHLAYAYAAKHDYDGIVMITDSESGSYELPGTHDAYFANPAHRGVLVQLEMNRYSAMEQGRNQTLHMVGLDANVPRLASAFVSGTL